MDTRNTKQKEIIMETLCHDKSHPTIQELYRKVAEVEPKIGQATVYRNVNRLVEEGRIIKIPTLNNIDRYDANCSPHYHLFCIKCNKLIDIYDDTHLKFIDEAEEKNHLKITQANIFFEGVCKECLASDNGDKNKERR